MNPDEKKKLLVLRFNNYKNNDFIVEHKKIIDKNGAVWLLKLGKPVPKKALEEILLNTGGLILKAPKARGGNFYYCKMLDARNSRPDSNMKFPEYYKEMMDDLFWFSFEGTWIKINGFRELNDSEILKLKLIRNNRLLPEVLMQTRTTMLYAYSTDGEGAFR